MNEFAPPPDDPNKKLTVIDPDRLRELMAQMSKPGIVLSQPLEPPKRTRPRMGLLNRFLSTLMTTIGSMVFLLAGASLVMAWGWGPVFLLSWFGLIALTLLFDS